MSSVILFFISYICSSPLRKPLFSDIIFFTCDVVFVFQQLFYPPKCPLCSKIYAMFIIFFINTLNSSNQASQSMHYIRVSGTSFCCLLFILKVATHPWLPYKYFQPEINNLHSKFWNSLYYFKRINSLTDQLGWRPTMSSLF